MNINEQRQEERMIRGFFSNEAPSLVISPDFFRNPTPDTLLQMYHFMCDLIFDFNEKEREMSDKNGPLTRYAICSKVHQYLTGLFCDIVFNEAVFYYKDLICPDPKRTRYFLVQLIRFYQFKCERQQEVDSVNTEMEERKRDLDAEIAFAKNSYDQLEKQRVQLDEVSAKRMEVEEKKNEVANELKALKDSCELLRKDFAAKQEKEKEFENKSLELKAMIEEATEKQKRLEMNIVTSPDRILNDIAHMEEELQTCISKRADLDKELRKLERDVNDQDMMKQFVEHYRAELKGLEALQDTLTEHRRACDESNQAVKDIENRLRLAREEFADRQSKADARVRQLRDQCDGNRRKAEMMTQEKEVLHNDLKTLTERCAKLNQEIRQLQMELKKISIALQHVGDTFDRAVQNLVIEQRKIEKKVDEEEAVLKLLFEKASVLGTEA